MNIHIASHSGFCFGVRSAVEKTELAASGLLDVATYGELIHNGQVIDKLKEKGVEIIEDLEDHRGRLVVIRSHGVPPEVYGEADSLGVQILDATCPYVKKIHRIVEAEKTAGRLIVIVGTPSHPEVMGIAGWAGENVLIIDSVDGVEIHQDTLTSHSEIAIVAQTTITKTLFDGVVKAIEGICVVDAVHNTICSATTNRQNSTAEVAAKVDFMIVIGGSKSSNTQKLYQIAKKYCENTIYVETVEDLVVKDVIKYDNIGITAGASTPECVIKEIVDKLENEGGVIING